MNEVLQQVFAHVGTGGGFVRAECQVADPSPEATAPIPVETFVSPVSIFHLSS